MPSSVRYYTQRSDRKRLKRTAAAMRQGGGAGGSQRRQSMHRPSVEAKSREAQRREINQAGMKANGSICASEVEWSCDHNSQAQGPGERWRSVRHGCCCPASRQAEGRDDKSSRAALPAGLTLSPPAPRPHRSPPQSCRRPLRCCCPRAAAVTAVQDGERGGEEGLACSPQRLTAPCMQRRLVGCSRRGTVTRTAREPPQKCTPAQWRPSPPPRSAAARA